MREHLINFHSDNDNNIKPRKVCEYCKRDFNRRYYFEHKKICKSK